MELHPVPFHALNPPQVTVDPVEDLLLEYCRIMYIMPQIIDLEHYVLDFLLLMIRRVDRYVILATCLGVGILHPHGFQPTFLIDEHLLDLFDSSTQYCSVASDLSYHLSAGGHHKSLQFFELTFVHLILVLGFE